MYTGRRTTERTEAEPTVDGAASRAEVAYRTLKQRLLVGDFSFGERLAEGRLATDLEVSRTPVREALSRLHTEGLVERHSEGGFRPALPDLHRTHELYQVRFALELHALHLPSSLGRTHDTAFLEELHHDWGSLAETGARADPSFVLLDEDFHIGLASAAGNQALVDMLASVNERIRLVRMHDFLTPERVTATIDQHLTIVSALLDHDVERAGTRLEAHLGQSLEIVEQRAATAVARMVSAGPMTDPVHREGEDA